VASKVRLLRRLPFQGNEIRGNAAGLQHNGEEATSFNAQTDTPARRGYDFRDVEGI